MNRIKFATSVLPYSSLRWRWWSCVLFRRPGDTVIKWCCLSHGCCPLLYWNCITQNKLYFNISYRFSEFFLRTKKTTFCTLCTVYFSRRNVYFSVNLFDHYFSFLSACITFPVHTYDAFGRYIIFIIYWWKCYLILINIIHKWLYLLSRRKSKQKVIILERNPWMLVGKCSVILTAMCQTTKSDCSQVHHILITATEDRWIIMDCKFCSIGSWTAEYHSRFTPFLSVIIIQWIISIDIKFVRDNNSNE